jgi:hypothetical protein
MHIKFIFPLLLILFLTGCFKKSPSSTSTAHVEHTIFDSLLRIHVDENGWVDYDGFQKDSVVFHQYLNVLSENPPSDTWMREEKLAYWINTYNAYTIELILQYEPKESIKDITNINIPFVSSPWQIDFIPINDKLYNLDDIEHGIIRKEFDEPRIHFALVCAAVSCPKLRNEAYTGSKLEMQLIHQTRDFLRDANKNQINSQQAKLSPIFKWYGSDFSKEGNLIRFLNRYAPTTIERNAKVEFLEYNWDLNSQENKDNLKEPFQ